MLKSARLRIAMVTLALSPTGCGFHERPPASLSFIEGCWQDLKSPPDFSRRMAFTRNSENQLTGTLRENVSQEPILDFLLPIHGESIEVTSHPAVPYVSSIQTVTLKRAITEAQPIGGEAYKQAAFAAPAYMSHLSFTVWRPEGEPEQMLFHVSNLEGWISADYEKEFVVIADRIRCSA